jgi:hypothetical protein
VIGTADAAVSPAHRQPVRITRATPSPVPARKPQVTEKLGKTRAYSRRKNGLRVRGKPGPFGISIFSVT